jgi:proteasome lid subunit RPN8/RPN11
MGSRDMGFMNRKLYLKKVHWKEMLLDIQERNSEEACGIIAGVDETSCAVFPVTNISHSPVRFLMDPEEQLKVFNYIEEQDWDLLAIYHSHLAGPAGPSPIDIAEAYYPETLSLIWSNLSGDWICQGYLISDGQVTLVPIRIIQSG